MKVISLISFNLILTLISMSNAQFSNGMNKQKNKNSNAKDSQVDCVSDNYSYDESINENTCTNDCMCDKFRTCSNYGWC